MGEGEILCAPFAGVATGGAIRSPSRSMLGGASPWVTRVKKHRRELSAFFRIPKWTRDAIGEYFFSEFGSLPVLWSGSVPVRALLGRTFLHGSTCTPVDLLALESAGLSPCSGVLCVGRVCNGKLQCLSRHAIRRRQCQRDAGGWLDAGETGGCAE